MNVSDPAFIKSFLLSTGASEEQIQAAYARSIAGIGDCLRLARKRGRYNGLTVAEWETQLAAYRLKAGEVLAV